MIILRRRFTESPIKMLQRLRMTQPSGGSSLGPEPGHLRLSSTDNTICGSLLSASHAGRLIEIRR